MSRSTPSHSPIVRTSGYSREDCERDDGVRLATTILADMPQWRHVSSLFEALPFDTWPIVHVGELSARVAQAEYGEKHKVRNAAVRMLIASDSFVAVALFY